MEILRGQIPPPPAAMDEAILGALRRAGSARGERRARRAAWCDRARLRWVAGMATALAAVTLLMLVPSGPSPHPSLAAASVPFTSQCTNARLEVAGPWRGPEGANFRRVLARFERRNGVKVTYAYETRDIARTLKERLARGCPPDVAMLPQPGLLRDLARRDELKPLPAAIGRLVRRTYAGEWRRRATVDGKLYGVWFKAANKSTFWYSRSAFKRAGVHPPHTWRELLRVAARLRATGIAPFAIAGADGWTLTDWFENLYVGTAGRARYDALAGQALRWTDPTVLAALDRLADVLGRGGWLAGGVKGALGTDFEEATAQVFDGRHRAAMMFEGDFVTSFVPGQQQSDVGHFAFPRLRGDRSTTIVGGDVAAQFTPKPLARKLMEFLATPDAAVPWARAGGFISPNLGLDRRAYPDATTRRLARAVTSAPALRFDLSDLQPPAFGGTAGQGMWRILQRYLADTSAVVRTSHQLESAARGARLCERLVGGSC